MKILDSNQKSSWTGKGFSSQQPGIIVYKNANFKHKILLKNGEYNLKLLAKNRTGNSPLYIKIISERNIVLYNEKFDLGKDWKEYNANFKLKKNYGSGYIVIYREKAGYGSIEIGRIFVDIHKELNSSVSKKRNIVKDKNFEEPKVAKKILKRKIAFIIPYGIYGGAEIYLKRIIDNIDNKIFNIHILYFKDNLLKNQVKNNTVIHKLISSKENFKNYLKNYNFDYVVYYNSVNIYKALQSAISDLNNPPKLVEIYHSDFRWSDSLSSLHKRNNTHLMLTVSKGQAQEVSGVKHRECLPVPININKFVNRDIDREELLNLDISGPVIGTVARLSSEKNIDYVLDIAKNMPEFNFLIFGKGSKESQLKMRKESEDISNLYFMGFKSNIEQYYNCIDSFLLTSNIEGTPISILEAMASGVPVFTTNVGNISSIVEEGKTGFFIPLKNAKESAQIIKNNMYNLDVILNGKKYVEEVHDEKKIAEKFMSKLLDINNSFIKRQNTKILDGEYI